MKKRQALVVGINDYLVLHELRTPANDANAVAQKLIELGFEVTGLPAASTQEAWRVHPEKQLLTHELENAITNLFALDANVSIPETALLFFAGHGLRKVKGNLTKGFLATSRVDSKESWGFPLKELREILEKSRVKQQIVILDCCHAGELLNFDEADPGDGETISRCFIAACREFEPAYEPTTGEHSVLTEALLQGLQQEGIISNVTLSKAIETALQTRNQTPICHNWGEIVLRDPGVELPEEILQDECPYKGLEAFQERDAKYFFGRDKLTQTLVYRLRDSQFLAVLGISGSGKSSLVRAGLIPDLKQGSTLSESKTWKICTPFKPGDDPLASLAQVLVDENLCTSEQATQELAKGAKGLHRLISPANAPCVFVVDQFEQVFTQCQDPAKRSQFFDCLLGATDSDSLRDKGDWGRSATSPLRVIITMRADFLGKCAEYPQLAKLIETHQAIVTEMKEAELREAIGKPAKKVNWNIPPDLENLMVADVQKSPGSLPLLQDILQQLWDRRSQRLTVQTYQDMGGVQKALQNRANKVYQTLSPEQQTIARSIFLELTQLLENTKPTARQVRKTQLTDLPPSPKQVETVLDKLETARLVVTSELQARGNPEDKITVVDVAHESLISNWEQLEQWVNENPEVKRQRDEIQAKARDWEDKGKRREGLLRGADLVEVEVFERKHGDTFPLSALAREFVRKSIRQRRTTRIVSISAVLAVLTLVTGLWLNAQRQATIANLRAKAAQAQNLLTSTQPLDGLVLAIQATGESQDKLRRVMSVVEASLLTSIQTTLEQNRYGHQSWVFAVAISADGQTIVSGSSDNTVRLWNHQGEQIGELRGHQGSVNAVAISVDGQTIVSGSSDNTVRLWNHQGEQIG
ncbi:nSTAND1 domain-containing NTPase, partial [Laspinema palackyanum]|uniref:nSTAND1 domain-containing NTPase n=1 Tax=Laspinema palackyanum TaxID=3231601 RepID=UPI00345D7FBE|nr:caspase family protein [Laspinema sp. D2c]